MSEFEYRDGKKTLKKCPPKRPPKKFNFKKAKNNTVKSLFEIEHFLQNFKQIVKGVKFYKVFKW